MPPPCDCCGQDYPGRRCPQLLPENLECNEIYTLCFAARDGLTGSLDYAVVCHIMQCMQIDPEDQLDILHKIQAVEAELRKKRG